MADIQSKKILRGKERIMRYMDIGVRLFEFFMSRGLPVSRLGRDFWAHADNIDDYMRVFTGRKLNMPDLDVDD